MRSSELYCSVSDDSESGWRMQITMCKKKKTINAAQWSTHTPILEGKLGPNSMSRAVLSRFNDVCAILISILISSLESSDGLQMSNGITGPNR